MLDYQHWPESSGILDYLKKMESSFRDIGSTPFEVLEQAGSLTLRKYQSVVQGPVPARNPILILPSLINRSFVLDLLPEKSVIGHFLRQGHDVYLVDWGVPLSHERHLSFESLLTVYFDFFLKRIELDAPGCSLHLVGHCLGGTLGLIVANLWPERFLSLTLITAPVRFRENDKLSLWCRSPDFDLEAFVEAYGNIPWVLLQSTFIALKPTQIVSKFRHLLARSRDQKFLRNFWAMEAWSNDNIDFRGECFKTLLEGFYKANSLEESLFEIEGRKIDLRTHELPTFVLVAKSDHIVPAGSHLIPEMVPRVQNFTSMSADGGHIGALLGGSAQKVVWPELNKWMRNCET